MDNKERNSNVILLIVIAIATMIIVVVGATFAYLASTADSGDAANVNAGFQEGGSDLLLIDAGKTLNVEATYDNFGKGQGDQADYGMAKVILQASAETPATYYYDVYLDTEANDMVYTSGKCYKKTEVNPGFNTQADCTTAWAKVSGSDAAACYQTPAPNTAVEGDLYESEIGCLTADTNMWVIDSEIAELAFDIYKPVAGVTSADACYADPATTLDTDKGVCIDKQRKISTTITTADACTEAGFTWTPNYFDEASSTCFKVDQSKDITTAKVGEEEKVLLYEDVGIQAEASTTVTDSYRVAVVLVNLPHNQIANGGHRYAGRLNIVRVPEPEATPIPGPTE